MSMILEWILVVKTCFPDSFLKSSQVNTTPKIRPKISHWLLSLKRIRPKFIIWFLFVFIHLTSLHPLFISNSSQVLVFPASFQIHSEFIPNSMHFKFWFNSSGNFFKKWNLCQSNRKQKKHHFSSWRKF